jgi:hypothetical protein
VKLLVAAWAVSFGLAAPALAAPPPASAFGPPAIEAKLRSPPAWSTHKPFASHVAGQATVLDRRG